MGMARGGLKVFDKIVAGCATALLADSFSQRLFLIDQHVLNKNKI